ncbi:MAG: dihydropyrimidinase [Salinivirgaceae bacterium]
MAAILIKNGTVINHFGRQKADVLIIGKKIAEIGSDIENVPEDSQIIDASGKLILPGGIDPHVHFHLKTPAGYSTDDFISGSKAALAGGTTTIIDFVTPNKNESLPVAYEMRLADAKGCLCDYGFHISPIDFHKGLYQEMKQCVENIGIPSFKVYMAYKGSIGIDHETLEKTMVMAARLNAMVTIHAEEGDEISKLQQQYLANGHVEPIYHALSRPSSVETDAVRAAIALAKKTKAEVYFVHVSSPDSMKCIVDAQLEGFPIYAETCPQYLLLTIDKLKGSFEQAAPYVFSPALRDSNQRDVLWEYLKNGSIQTIGTDHCPFNLKGQKELGINDFTKIPNGAGGVEHRLELMYTFGVLTGKITLEQMVSMLSFKPAQIFGIKNKGQITRGYDADVVIWNPVGERIISTATNWQQCDSNIYEGISVTGKVDSVFLRGELAYKDKSHGYVSGNYLKRELLG